MRNVTELNQNELSELRARLYHQLLDDGSLEEVVDKKIDSPDDLPMSLVKDHYRDTYFVEDDFFCNQKIH